MKYYFEEKKANYELPTRKRSLTAWAHVHSNVELIYMLEGTVEATVNGNSYTLKKGDLFFVFPNQVHYYENYNNLDCVMTVFNPAICGQLGDAFSSNVPSENVIECGENSDVPYIIKKIDEKRESPFFENVVSAYYMLISDEIFSRTEMTTQITASQELIFSVIQYCVNNYRERITLDSVSKELSISKYYISRIFSEKINMNFKDYVNGLRIREAQHMLVTTSRPISEIALDIGFSSFRSFNRLFKETVGMTPSDYRNKGNQSARR